MRFKSRKVDGYQVFAVSGTNTISFGVKFDKADTRGLLGFAVERSDPTENERYFVFGFKVFPSVIPEPDDKTTVRTNDHPIQSFVWDDFTAKPGRDYEYFFHPVKGSPKNLDRSARAIPIKVRTEPLFSTLEHDIFFNRGVASSQAYSRRFENKKPDQLPLAKQKEAREWLSRSLDEALLKFISNAKKNDTLLCCFYEFRYLPVATAIKEAIDRGVKVQLIIDGKVNEKKDKNGKTQESFPREENLRTLDEANIPKANVIMREAKPNDIQHNKFMVLLKGARGAPTEAWTGSTNISEGGIHGQTNVGHWVRDPDVAKQFAGLLGAAKRRSRRGGAATTARPPFARTRRSGARWRSCTKHRRRSTTCRRASRRSSARAADRRARHVRENGRRRRTGLVHHACVRHQRRLQGSPRRQHAAKPDRLLPARKGGQAEPAQQEEVRRAQRGQQRLQGLGLIPARAVVPVDAGRPMPRRSSSTSTSATSIRSSC